VTDRVADAVRRDDPEGAARLDRRIELILRGLVPTAGSPSLAQAEDAPGPDADLVAAASLLARGLTRFHPSFRFEEQLADRLRAAARGGDLGEPAMLAFPASAAPGLTVGPDGRRGGKVFVGGAIASGVSLAGAAAILAWRAHGRRARGRRLAVGGGGVEIRPCP
jgi:hypothetical protein